MQKIVVGAVNAMLVDRIGEPVDRPEGWLVLSLSIIHLSFRSTDQWASMFPSKSQSVNRITLTN